MSFWFTLLSLLFSLNVHAQGNFGGDFVSSSSDQFLMNLSFFYTGDNFELSVDRKRTDTLLQGLLGYRHQEWLFALTYDSDVEKQSFTSGLTTQDVRWNRVAYGPTIGYFFYDYYVHFTYFVTPLLKTVDDLNSSNTDYSKGSGLQLVFGYAYPVTSSFSVGIQIAYRSFEYKESQVGSTTTTGTFRQAMVDPMLTFLLYL